MKKVTIYSTPTCHFCSLAKDYFNENKIQFEAFDVASDLQKRREMVEKSGQLGVPVILIDNEVIVGFDKSKIDQVLGLGMKMAA
jgi:glutaredoxin-like YruB-family protein